MLVALTSCNKSQLDAGRSRLIDRILYHRVASLIHRLYFCTVLAHAPPNSQGDSGIPSMPLLSIISGVLRAERFAQPECELIQWILKRKSTTYRVHSEDPLVSENNIPYCEIPRFAVPSSFVATARARFGTRRKEKLIIKRITTAP